MISFLPQVRVVEAFVNSGGNAILRTADGNIISSGVGAGLGGYGSSSSGVMGTNIVVGSSGQVSTYYSFLSMSRLRIRGVVGGAVSSVGGGIFIGRSDRYVNVRVIQSNMQTSSNYVEISSAGGGTAVGTSVENGGSNGGGGADGGGASNGAGAGVDGGSDGTGGGGGAGVDGGSDGTGGGGGGAGVGGVSGDASGGGSVSGGGGVGVASGGGVTVAGSTLGSAGSRDAYGKVTTYGSSLSSWTLGGATTDGTGDIEVIGDFGGK